MNRAWPMAICGLTVAQAAVAQSASQYPITIDGLHDDWAGVPLAWSDPRGDGGPLGIDLGRLWMANDERFLFLRFELGVELQLDENNALRLYIDADDNASTGLSIAGIGAEMEWRYGSRTGIYYAAGGTAELTHALLRFRAGPTVSAATFETAIGRDASFNGVTPMFVSPTIRIVLMDASEQGDMLPDAGQVVTYAFVKDPLPSLSPIGLERVGPNDVRLLSHNVKDDTPWMLPQSQKFARLWTAVNPDVLCFQEIYNHTTEQTLSMVQIFLGGPPGTWQAAGNADCKTVSRFPILQSWAIDGNLATLIDTSPPELPELPGALGRHMLLINAHLPCCANDAGRQAEIDRIMAFIRDARAPGGDLTVPADTAVVIAGDLNLVGLSQQLTSLLTGDIVNEAANGPDFAPDWDGSDLANRLWRQTDKRMGYTWRSDAESFWPGHLDFVIYSDSVLTVSHRFALYTPEMPAPRLAQYGLLAGDSLASDHLVICADLRSAAQPGDITGDSIVNIDDLLAVINFWGPCADPRGPCPADVAPAGTVAGNGVVNIDDLLMVINSWTS
jgi:hypothetical protein